jgi:hypothetical protein
MKNDTITLDSYALPTAKEGNEGTIFNSGLFHFVYDRMAKLKPEAQRQWGKMNIAQMVNHLKVSTASGLNLYRLKDESSFLWRHFIKFLVIRILNRLPRNARAPEGFKIEMKNVLDFRKEKAEVLKILEQAHASTNHTFPHPLFGKMTRLEWGKLVYRHFDHHLRQFNA